MPNQADSSKKHFSHSSSSQNPANNTGESMAQGGGDEIVNEQEQNKSVNQEEFIDDLAANTHFYESEKAGLAKSTPTPDMETGETHVRELSDDPDEAGEQPKTILE